MDSGGRVIDPFYEGDQMRLYVGDARTVLRELPEQSVQCVVTSPPYFMLREYEGVPTEVWGGRADCEHHWSPWVEGRRQSGGTGKSTLGAASGGNEMSDEARVRSQERQGTESPRSRRCSACGAWEGHLGLEPHVHLYVKHLAEVFAAVHRVLRDDGTLFLNLGDTYVNKQLQGAPWRVALYLQRKGWWLRNDNVWSKPGPMPEQVNDRCARAHEYVFLLTKGPSYYFDKEAIKEPAKWERWGDQSVRKDQQGASSWIEPKRKEDLPDPELGRNPRTIWTINTANYPDAHFAVFPTELPEKCIMAGTSEKGCCGGCGMPFERMIEKEGETTAERKARQPEQWQEADSIAPRADGGTMQQGVSVGVTRTRTIGWQPGCMCGEEPVPCTVLDPFSGSGTTMVVARRLGRAAVGVELSAEYAAQSRDKRLIAWWKDAARAPAPAPDQLQLLDTAS